MVVVVSECVVCDRWGMTWEEGLVGIEGVAALSWILVAGMRVEHTNWRVKLFL